MAGSTAASSTPARRRNAGSAAPSPAARRARQRHDEELRDGVRRGQRHPDRDRRVPGLLVRAQHGRRDHAAALHELGQRPGARGDQPEPRGVRGQVHGHPRSPRQSGRSPQRRGRARRHRRQPRRRSHRPPGHPVQRDHRGDEHGVLHRETCRPGAGAAEAEVGLQGEGPTTFRARASNTHTVSRAGNPPPDAENRSDEGEQHERRDPVAGEASVNARARPRRCSGRSCRDVAGQQRRPAECHRDGPHRDQRQRDGRSRP